jgi:hypothetical protein
LKNRYCVIANVPKKDPGWEWKDLEHPWLKYWNVV